VQGKYTVTLIEGDGIGPEISQSVKDIFAAAKVYGKTARHGEIHADYILGPHQVGIC
jgi:isocitrate/isopropylmalate dehydrogenase